MDSGGFTDSVILLVCGMLVAMYGARKGFRKVSRYDTSSEKEMRIVTAIGVLLVVLGAGHLLWQLF